MLFQQLNRDTAEKVFVICRNVSGATQSAGNALYLDTASVTDGVGVSGCRTPLKYLFVGINNQSLSDSSYGLVQVYGVASAYMVLNATGVSATPGTQLDAVASAAYLKDYAGVAGSSTVVANPWNFVTLMDTYASAAAAQSTVALKKVFVRAL
jgi:hypothetical protein